MKKAFLFIAGAAVILAGCAREASIETPDTGRKHITIQASVDPETKTTVDIANNVGTYSWTPYEVIAVFESTAEEATPFSACDVDNGYFDGEILGSNTLVGAVTPYSAVTSFESEDGDVMYTLTLSGDYNFGESNAIMVAPAPESVANPTAGGDPLYKFQFKHVAGLMMVTYENVPIGTAGVRFTTNVPIVGSVVFDTLTDVEISNTDVSDGESETAYVHYESVVTEPNTTGVFYIPIPTGSYTGFEIALVDDQDNPIPGTKRSKTSTFTVGRSKIVRIPKVTLQEVEVVSGYVKVTDNSQISEGDYLIVYEGGTVGSNEYGSQVLTGVTSGNSPYGTVADVTISDGVIDEDDYSDYNIVAAKSGDYYTLKQGDVYLETPRDDKNYLGGVSSLDDLDDAEMGKWTLTSNSVTNVKFSERQIRWNPNVQSGVASPRFSTYKTGQQAIALYKKTSGVLFTKINPELSFSGPSTITLTLDEVDDFTAPALNNPYGVPVTWSSDNDDLAVVVDGEVLFEEGATGSVSITASSAETSVYAAGSASYTVVVIDGAITTISALKDFIDENEGSEAETEISLTNALVTWTNGSKAFIEDGTAGIYVYAGVTNDLQTGDLLNGDTKVKVKRYNGQREISAVTGASLYSLKTETQTVSATDLTIEDAISAEGLALYENMRVVIENATIVVSNNKKYLSDGTNQIQLFTLSGSGASLDNFAAGDLILSATGYPVEYKSGNSQFPELIIVSTDDIVKQLVPAISANPTSLSFTNEVGSQTITMTAENFSTNPTYQVTNNTNSSVFSTSVNGSTITVSVAANIGEAQIGTITIRGTAGVQSAETTVNLTQDAGSGLTTSYVKVTSLNGLSNGGQVVIVATSGTKNYALPINPTLNNGKITGAEITVTNNEISETNAAGYVWTITKSGNYYIITDGSKNLYHATGGESGTNLEYGSSTSYLWSFSEASGGTGLFKVAAVVNTTVNSRGLLATSSGSFGGYALSNFTNSAYAGIDFYKKTTSGGQTTSVDTPTFTVAGGTYTSAQSVGIQCATSGATIYYTLDGTTPDASKTPYTSPISISTTTTVKAIAIKDGVSSDVATATYTINLPAEKTATLTITNVTSLAATYTDDKGNTWSVGSDASKFTSSTSYLHAGTNSSPVSYISLSSSAYSTVSIKEIHVWAAAKANTNVTTKIGIGGTQLGESSVLGATQANGGTEFYVTNTANLSGTISVNISRPTSANGAIYFNKLTVVYED